MLLRRVTENVTNQNWTAVVLDFLVVVAGIVVGLQATDWYTQRQETALAESYAARLEIDFKAIVEESDTRIAKYDEQQAMALTVENALFADVDTAQTDADLLEMFGLLMTDYKAPSPSAVFLELRQNQSLSILADDELPEALISCDYKIIEAVAAGEKMTGFLDNNGGILLELFLDMHRLPPKDVMNFALANKREVVRALTLINLVRENDVFFTQRVRTCAEQVLERLNKYPRR